MSTNDPYIEAIRDQLQEAKKRLEEQKIKDYESVINRLNPFNSFFYEDVASIADTPKPKAKPKVLKPEEIVSKLSKYVIGQDRAKKALAIGAYYHYFRIDKEVKNFKKSNICLIGPTGTGKTYLLETLAKVLNKPFVCVDSTEMTPDGYVGRDVGAFVNEIKVEDGQQKEHAIVFLDEADKISTHHGDTYKTTQIQQALLKLIEGKMAGKADNGYGRGAKCDTSKMLFVIGGAFSGITHKKDYNSEVSPQDLVKYGLMSEFVGRFPIISTLDPLRESDLADILCKPNNNIMQEFADLFKMHEVELIFSACAIDTIGKAAFTLKTGARGIRSIVESILSEHLYLLPSFVGRKVIIDKPYILKEKPIEATFEPRRIAS